MFKFLKEYLLDPIREGIAEAREELAAENAAQRQQYMEAVAAFRQDVAGISYTEKMGLALAAPFRAVDLTAPYFSIFSGKESGNRKLPSLNMFKMGILTDKETQVVLLSLKKDFDISGPDSLGAAFYWFAAYFDSDLKFIDRIEEQVAEKRKDGREKLMAEAFAFLRDFDPAKQIGLNNDVKEKFTDLQTFALGVLAYMTTSCHESGLLSRADALAWLEAIIACARRLQAGWEEFGQAFLTGETLFGINSFVGKRILKNTVNNLLAFPDSPWKNVSWN